MSQASTDTRLALSGPSDAAVSVICVSNSTKTLDEWLLRGLASQTLPYEQIVADGSQFSCAAAALNAGAAIAHGRWLLFIHNDVYLDNARFLEEAIRLAESINDLGVAGTAGALPGRRQSIGSIRQGTSFDPSPERFPSTQIRDVQTVDEHLMLCRADRFAPIRFDEAACPAWDLYGVDLCLAMDEAGWRNVVLPLSLHHRSFGRLTWNYARSLERVRKKHRNLQRQISTCCGLWSTRADGRLQYILHKARSAARRVVQQVRPPRRESVVSGVADVSNETP